MWTALRKIPVPLLAAELAMIIVPALGLMVDPFGDKNEAALLTDGGQFASAVLAVVGLAWLAPLMSGAARTGVRIAMFAAAAKVACSTMWLATLVLMLPNTAPPEMLFAFGPFAKMACSIAILVGLGVAARRWWIVAVAMVPAIVPFVAWRVFFDPLYGVSQHARSFYAIQTSCAIANGIALIVLTIVVCRNAAPLDSPARIAPGLRLAARGLYAFALATVLYVGSVLWFGADFGPSESLAHAITQALQLASLCVFAFGGLLAVRGRSELPSWAIVVGAAIVFAIVSKLGFGVLIAVQIAIDADPIHHAFLLYPFSLLYSRSGELLVVLAFGALLVAIAIGARRRGLEQLHTSVLVRTGVFTVLALGALTVQHMQAEDAALDAGGAVLFFASIAATLAALLVAASTVRTAARELAGEQYLPSAKLVRS